MTSRIQNHGMWLLAIGTAAAIVHQVVAAPLPPQDSPQACVLQKPARTVTMVQDGFLWLDAEDFADYGGWTLDTQFVHLMGSSYLIAASVNQPVADARTEIAVPKAGRYRLWVRAKNWHLPHSPGKFQVVIGGWVSPHVFGEAKSGEWLWEDGGELNLPAGKTSIQLRDLTGHYGRCDALLLTTDLNYTPPNELEALQKERGRLTGLSLEPREGGEFEVIVVGAGAAGCCAAIAAARTGAKTALINDRPVLGGNASVELGVHIAGAGSGHRNARESGIIEEAGRIMARHGHPKMSEPFRLLANAERNLTVCQNQRVIQAQMSDRSRIRGVVAEDTLTGARTRYGGKLFIDCTGDGWLGYYAGAIYRHGRESREEFGESLAPERADQINMSGCIMGNLAVSYRAEPTDHPVKYSPPPWAAQLPPADQFGRKPKNLDGQWWLEREGSIDTLREAEKSRDELIRITYGYWNFIKNH